MQLFCFDVPGDACVRDTASFLDVAGIPTVVGILALAKITALAGVPPIADILAIAGVPTSSVVEPEPEP